MREAKSDSSAGVKLIFKSAWDGKEGRRKEK